MTIGQRIKNRRLQLNLSVDELAAKLGKNRATVYRYEKDDIKELPITVLEPLARVLETTPADLMGWGDEETTADKLLETYESNTHSDEQLNRIIAYFEKLNQLDRDMLESMAKRFAEANKKDDN